MAIVKSTIRNRLLRALPDEDFEILAAMLEPVTLSKGMSLATADEAIDYCYFPETGVGSIVVASPEGLRTEVGLTGRDGFMPVAFVLGTDRSTQSIFMQVEGYGFRVGRVAFLEVVASRPRMQGIFLLYAQALFTQTASTALSNVVHHTEERLARWILMCHDRSEDEQIPLTHEFLSIMLAVRRPSVTTALHMLEGNHLIYSDRGMVTVRDREALESFARDAYGAPEREYERLLGPMR